MDVKCIAFFTFHEMSFFKAEEDFFSTVVYTELAPLETAMIVSQVWKSKIKRFVFKKDLFDMFS